ncbi:Isoleucine--tRNA ligase [uncultured archaeon]|nr:Isoleucine--tRNA ligase [uncultured archaeon]
MSKDTPQSESSAPSGTFNLKQMESEIAKYWEEKGIRQKVLNSRKGAKPYFFMDGPPYATGYIHMGTGLNKTLKDYYMRYFRMAGFDVNSQPGYDTHGVPIENKVEKKLGLKFKSDIEKFGIEQFNAECRKFATDFIGIMNEQFEDLGVWMDWENPYLTLHNYYIEGAWHTFKIAFEKGLLYKGIYPVHVCSHCATAVAYSEIEYQKATDPAVFVKFPAKSLPDTYFVIWTTTPWTLPSNTGIMVHPKFEYAKVDVDDETLIIAKELVNTVMKKAGIKHYKITGTVPGKELAGQEYVHPLKDILPLQKDITGRVILSEMFVTLTDGAGLVHTAPGHGKEDYKAGTENKLPKLCPVNLDGTFDKTAGKYAGKYVKEADAQIIADLKARGALLASEKVTHDYPHCWRCKSPLLQMSVPQWFFKVSSIQDTLISENKKVNWIPDWAGKRFGDWLLNLSDWPISRQRYWGIPLPIWVCDKCGEVKVIGSVDELEDAGKKLTDLHRPYIDQVTFKCRKCNGTQKRIHDVLDVWFDSGVASWASLKYPKEKEKFNKMWPAELNIEGPDQMRGWWNSQMICSVITFGKKPFNNIIMHGMVLDNKGVKMSKSLGNVIAPSDVIEKHSRDVLRVYLLSGSPESDFYFDWEAVKSVQKFFNILFNSVNFMTSYAPAGFKPAAKFDTKSLATIDKWMLSRINTLAKDCEKYNKSYVGYKSVSAIQDLIVNDFSRTYIKLTRDRTSPNYEGKDKESAFAIMDYVLRRVAVLIAPAAPFSAEKIYQILGGGNESVHLSDFPATDKKLVDAELERDMKVSLDIVEAINSIRQENNLRLRWPLKSATISGEEAVVSAVRRLEDVIKELANVKAIKFGEVSLEIEVKPNYKVFGPAFGKDAKTVADLLAKAGGRKVKEEAKKGKVKLGKFELTPEMLIIREKVTENLAGKTFVGGAVYLDTTRDEEIIQESLVRELVRHIQIMRKEAGLNVKEKIKLYLSGDEKLLSKWKSEIEKDTTSEVVIGAGGRKKSTFEFEDAKIEVGF